jgi:hypothetical protein
LGAFVGDGNSFKGSWMGNGKTLAFEVAVAAPKQPKPSKESTPDEDSESFDDRVGAEIRKLVDEFVFDVKVNWKDGSTDKSKNLTIRTPYFINTDVRGDAMKSNALRERGAAAGYSRTLLDSARKNPTLLSGKASSGDMQKFTQSLVNAMSKEKSANQITSTSVIAWLKRYGIGVDCSGFVTQALDRSIENVAGNETDIGDRRMFFGSGSLKGGQGAFAAVNAPADFRPGDTMWQDGHIRIVTKVGPTPDNKGIMFMTAESAIETPAGLLDEFGIDETYRPGLMEVVWRYPNANAYSGLQRKLNNHQLKAGGINKAD